jgi:hypothetical protein
MQTSFPLGMLRQHAREAKRLVNLLVQVLREAGVVSPQHLEEEPMERFAAEAR